MLDFKQLKQDLGLTQVALSNLLGCSQSTISALERRGNLSQNQLQILYDKYSEDVIKKYEYEGSGDTNINDINIGNAYGLGSTVDNSYNSFVDTSSIIKDYQDTIHDLRLDKQELKQQVAELKLELQKYITTYGKL